MSIGYHCDLRNWQIAFPSQLGRKAHLLYLAITKWVDDSRKIEGYRVSFTSSIEEMLEKKSYFLPSKFELDQNSLNHFFSGSQIEQTKFVAHPDRVLPMSTWDDWHTELPTAKAFYQTILHHALDEATERSLSRFEGRQLHGLDVAGGDGTLSFLLAKQPRIQSIYLIDQSRMSIQKAKNKVVLACLRKAEATHTKVKPIMADITQGNYSDLMDGKKADLIYLSGVVAHEVLTEAQSVEVLKKCKERLAPDGLIFITSYTGGHFNRCGLRKMGFRVLNQTYSLWDPERKKMSLVPLYILQHRKW